MKAGRPIGLAPPWRRWVIENLRAGAAVEEVAADLAERGVPAELAAQEVASVADTLALLAEDRLARRLALATRLVEDPPTLLTVPTLDADALLDARRTNRPVYYPGLVAGWAAVHTWTFAALAERFGAVPVTFCSGRNRDPSCDRNYREHEETAPLATFLERVAAAGTTNDLYLISRNRAVRDTPLGALLDELRPLPPGVDAARFRAGASLWIGPAGTFIPLHHDQNHALFFQLRGRKHVELHSPRRPGPMAAIDGTFTRWEPDEPGYTLTLAPGDALFLPAGRWHAVRALDPSISVSSTSFVWPNDLSWYAPGRV